MSLLSKFKPGVLGFVIIALIGSTISTSVMKSANRPIRTSVEEQGNVSRAAVPQRVDTEPSEPMPEAPEEPEDQPTYYQYQIDIELENIANLIKSEAKDRIESGVTVEQINGSLVALSKEPQTPETTARKLYLLRALQTLKDGEAMPKADPIKTPTLEDYKDVIEQD